MFFFVLVLVDVVCIILNCNFSDSKRCSVLCNGMFTSKNKLYDLRHCVAFNIRFSLDNEYSTQLRGFPCNISKCLLETIYFECFNETSRNGNQGNGTGCEGNLNFELIQLLVVTVKSKKYYTLILFS